MKIKPKNQEGIVTLIAILAIGMFSLGIALTVTTGALAGLVKNRSSVSGDQVFYTAEYGSEEGAYQFINDKTFTSGDPLLLNNTTAGSITVAPLSWPYYEIRGHAENSSNNRNSVFTLTIFPEGEAFDYAIFANHELNVGGSTEVNGDIFANGDIEFTGNKSDINGNAYSAGTVEDSDNVNGESTNGTEPIPAPTLDLDPYRDIAIADGTYFDKSEDAEDLVNGNTVEAVVFIEAPDKTKLQGKKTDVTGSVASANDLSLNGGTYTAGSDPSTGENYAAIVVDGDLHVAGGATINGVVYVTGTTTFGAGNNTINGSLVSAGGASVEVGGNTTINYDPDFATVWPSLAGLEKDTDEAPKIILWNED